MRRPLAVLALAATIPLACGGAPSPAPLAPPPQPPSSAPAAPLASASAAPTTPAGAIDKDFLRRFSITRRFSLGSPSDLTPTPDGKAILFVRSGARDPKRALYETDLTTGQTRLVIDADALLKGDESLTPAEKARRERMRVSSTGLVSFQLSKDGARVLLPLSGRVFVFDRKAGKARELPTGPGVLDPRLSPDGKRVAYVRGSELYVVGVDGGAETRLTKDGGATTTNGLPSFIDQEELLRYRGFWFSPDGESILYEQVDNAGVEVLSIADPAHPDRKPYESAYPFAGKTNAKVRFGIVPSRGGATRWVSYDAARFPYAPRVTWTKNAPPTLTLMDRAQKNEQVVAVDVATGKTTALLEEHDDVWLNFDPSAPAWTPDGKGLLWSTEKNGAWELELRDAKGAFVRTLVGKEQGYREIVDVDASRVFVAAAAEPTDTALYEVPLAGGEARRLAGEAGQEVHAAFGEGFDVVAARVTSRAAMPRYEARWLRGDRAPVAIPAVNEDPGPLPNVEFAEVGPDRVRVAIVRPRSFVPGKKYALVDSAYGGPWANTVLSNVRYYLESAWVADALDAIVVSMDTRGTPRRGREWERATYKKFVTAAIDGHVDAIQALAARYPEIDPSRVGVFGWSFGGSFSAMAVLYRPDVYKAAFAGAPVTDQRNYDSAYTERYMGMPDADPAAYESQSVVVRARRADGPVRPLFLVHGTADDNVYFFNSLQLVDALARAHRPVEFMPVAGMTHMPVDPDMVEAMWLRAIDVLRRGLTAP